MTLWMRDHVFRNVCVLETRTMSIQTYTMQNIMSDLTGTQDARQ